MQSPESLIICYRFIHGGAWRSPLITSRSIGPSLPFLSPSTFPIAAVASLNYRLSPYPSHATLPSDPSDKSRNAKHPDHIIDVLTAIGYLQQQYGFGSQYVLVGHSVGATLALQVAMGLWEAAPSSVATNAESHQQVKVEQPVGIVGVEGIYDLRALRDANPTQTAYQQFLEAAMGKDESVWDTASPVSGSYATSWPGGKVMVSAHSREDELVDMGQVEMLRKRLHRERGVGREDIVVQLQGKHDEVWEQGVEMARAVEAAFHQLEEHDAAGSAKG